METLTKNSNIENTKLLVDTVQKLSLARDIEAVMRIVRSVARELTGADGASFVLRDGDQCYYADEDAIGPLWKGSRFPIKECISGWVMLHKKPVVIKDIYMDDRIPKEAYCPTFVKSLAMVPIRSIEPLGAIGNYWSTIHQPTDQEVAMLQSLADITAVSIENIEIRNQLEKNVEERTSELADALSREKETHQMKSAFVSMASHEFRTPLGAILTSAFLSQKYLEMDEHDKCDNQLIRIKSSVKVLTDILNDFLSLDRLEHGKVEAQKEYFDLEVFLEDISEELNGIKKEGQKIHYTHTGTKEILVDKKILRNVMFNLLSNGIKYSEKAIELRSEVTGDLVKLIVKDQGIGIPWEQQEKLFSKFFRASNAVDIQGTGLGLNIVKHYIDLLEGTIDFTSQENIGTTFTIQIPINLEKNGMR